MDGSGLSAAMLVDVLRAIRKVRRIQRVIIVSPDVSVRRIARLMGAHFLWEGKRKGLNKGVRLALHEASQRGATAALILPSDIPRVKPVEIKRFLALSNGYQVALVPSKDRGGTNALLLRPPEVMGPAFGRDSFRRHLANSKKRGLTSRVVRLRSIAFDIDEPADLTHLRGLALRNEAGRFLKSLNVRREIKV